MENLIRNDQIEYVRKLLTLVDDDPTPETVHRTHERLWRLPGRLGDENGVVVDFGEYIGTLDEIVSGKYEDDGWLYHFKRTVIEDLEGLIDPSELERFAKGDHLEMVTGRKMITQ